MSEGGEISVKDLDGLTAELLAQEKIKADVTALLTSINKKIMQLEQKCTLHLKELGRTEYKSDYGTLKIKERWTVSLPKTDLDKLEFFAWLKENGIFERYATVNSMSLNSLFKAEWEQAKKEGNVLFSMPGIPAPKVFEQTEFKANKEKLKELENGSESKSNNNEIAEYNGSADEIPY